MCGGTGVFGVSEGGQSTTEQLKDILTGVKAMLAGVQNYQVWVWLEKKGEILNPFG